MTGRTEEETGDARKKKQQVGRGVKRSQLRRLGLRVMQRSQRGAEPMYRRPAEENHAHVFHGCLSPHFQAEHLSRHLIYVAAVDSVNGVESVHGASPGPSLE